MSCQYMGQTWENIAPRIARTDTGTCTLKKDTVKSNQIKSNHGARGYLDIMKRLSLRRNFWSLMGATVGSMKQSEWIQRSVDTV